MAPKRRYYSRRIGTNSGDDALDLPMIKRLFLSVYEELDSEGWFQEAFGVSCTDAPHFRPGTLGGDVEGAILFALRKDFLWPIRGRIGGYCEADLFDIFEFLYDHVSYPIQREWHSWNECGWHCEDFDTTEGRARFREKINAFLPSYGPGFELSHDGEVLTLPDPGLQTLLDAPLPLSTDHDAVTARVDAAVLKFRRYEASIADRQDALRGLADVLEFLRPEAKKVLSSKDEADLFTLANNFGIRHHNSNQKTEYDRAIWLSWAFYYYLATIHASLRLIDKARK
jgi:hypothetical protein